MNDARPLTDVRAQVDAADGLPALAALWQARDPSTWQRDAEAYRRLGARALKLGEPIFGYDVVSEGLQHWPTDVRLRQLQALALARSGARQRAAALLTRLAAEGHSDEETLGMLARTHKDFWLQATDDAERARQLHLARDTYLKAYELNGGYWTAINAATLSLLLGETERAHALAREVQAACRQELAGGVHTYGDRYWPLATLGEAALILNDLQQAADYYCAAANEPGSYGVVASTRRNMRLLIEQLGIDGARLEACLRVPQVVVCAGHMIDRPGRARPRFPSELEEPVRAAMRARLTALDARIGYSSAACGADIIFLEVMQELGGETNVVLPYNREQFIADSVAVAPGWRERFERALERAASVVVASEQKIGEGGLSYEYCNLLIAGLGRIRAEQLETGLLPLAVWDGRAGDGTGGTAGYVAQWHAAGREVDVIDPTRLLAAPQTHDASAHDGARAQKVNSATTPAPTDERAAAPAEFEPQIKALLFADAVHFSKLTEGQIPLFLRHFLEPVAQLLEQPDYAPDGKNTWGDGLYFVFDTVHRAGLFALALAEQLNRTDFAAKGLPPGLNLRIALHAGPVYACVDPITRRETFTGTHVSRAARIEPITPPGQVYASQAFAALAYAQGVREFACEYVGQTPLAKGYGTFPTYLVRRR